MIKDAFSIAWDRFYTGPVRCPFPSSSEMKAVGYTNPLNELPAERSADIADKGATAIKLASPTNPVSNLGVSLMELKRDGLPSLHGVSTWKDRTQVLKGLGGDYLNHQFGWLPLVNEVHSVTGAARSQRDILNGYHKGAGRRNHRIFRFPSDVSSVSKDTSPGEPFGLEAFLSYGQGFSKRHVSRVIETKCWFEGVFSYAVPSPTDSWRRAVGFGSDADKLYGIALTPTLLWEAAPWSWAVDWFSNTGDVISNVTNFALAGQSMRYGFLMTEIVERVTAVEFGGSVLTTPVSAPRSEYREIPLDSRSSGYETVSKQRVIASPFGFDVGWEGLSPTQLAITAALGITRLR